MDTLQDAYKDSEEDPEESSNPDPNQENQTPNPQINPLQNDNQNTKINPDKETHTSVLPNPSSSIITVTDSLAEETPIVPSAEPDPENKPELEVEPGPVAVESAKNENPTRTTEREPVENQAISEAGDEVTVKVEPLGSEDASTDSVSDDEQNPEIPENSDRKLSNEEDQEDQPSPKKQRSADPSSESQQAKIPASNGSKKSSKKKSKGNNVWTKSTSRKGKKKAKNNSHTTPKTEDTVFITPMPRFPDKNDDSRDAQICLSKVYKAEKVELSDDRLSAGSCKGYRMVRATRGVTEGTWYFEIKVVHLGESGHTRLGWSTEKGDLQAPVGYDANSFGYRDMDGSKIHKALRQKYAEEGYKEGDVIGFYINLPDGNSYAPKPPHLVWYKGQKYVCASDPKEDPPKVIPGSEMSFFKNGVCQGKAFTDLFGGRYYPAASMYTLPNQPNCVVKFNFGPDFECFPKDFGDRPLPRPMIEVPYHGLDNRIEIGEE